MKEIIGYATPALKLLNNFTSGLLRSCQFYDFVFRKFQYRKDDIFIVTYPRSGTTWTQMILYQMTSDGEMDFEHISEKVPFFERTLVGGFMSIEEANDLPSPRVFKTHLPSKYLPIKKARYIYIYRDGRDVALSFYYFYQRYLQFTGSFDEFFQLFLTGKVQAGSWFEHIQGWKEAAKNSDILWISYTDLKNDLDDTLDKISKFIDIKMTPEKKSKIKNRCHIEFMKEHKGKFEHFNEVLWETGRQFKWHKSDFIRSGNEGEGMQKLSKTQLNEFVALYNKELVKRGVDLNIPDTEF